MRKRGPSSKAGWSQSGAFREIARQAIKRHNARRRTRPKCGASRKHDGQPCQQPAMANGRCVWHGGTTPRGKNWHVVQWPKNPAKLFSKMRDIERRERKRRERVAKMTPEELARYQHWLATHQPGSASKRAARKVRWKQEAEAREILRPRLRAIDADQDALAVQIEALKRKRDKRLQASAENQGVFG